MMIVEVENRDTEYWHAIAMNCLFVRITQTKPLQKKKQSKKSNIAQVDDEAWANGAFLLVGRKWLLGFDGIRCASTRDQIQPQGFGLAN